MVVIIVGHNRRGINLNCNDFKGHKLRVETETLTLLVIFDDIYQKI